MDPEQWNAFANLVILRHRVAPSVAKAVSESGISIPEPVQASVGAEARANGFAALAQRRESMRLSSLFAAAGLQPVFLKGWALAEQLYGGPGLRHSNDIDLVVPLDARLTAADCLRRAGYEPAEGHALRGRLIATRAVRDECKDIQFINAGSGLVVELHWRTNHFRHWPELSDIAEPSVPLRGTDDEASILVPGPLGQLVYLSEHGQQHLFGRLKWLLDIAQLARIRGVSQLARDLVAAEAAGAGRAVRLALHLAGRVFGIPVPDDARMLGAREARWAMEILAGIADPFQEPGSRRARVGFYRWHLRMAVGPAQVMGVLRYAGLRPLRLGLARVAHPGDL